MREYVIQNEKLQLKVSEHGAEIRSLVKKEGKREIMFLADPAFWGRTSPILFPLVGNYWEKTSRYDGKDYHMSQHGFARDMDFTLEKQGASEIWLTLSDTEETREKYPFAFLLRVGYVLEGDTLKVCWEVENPNEGSLYFSLGGHPAFQCDLNHSYLELSKKGEALQDSLLCKIIEGDGSGCLSDREKAYSLEQGMLALSDALFDEDALIVEGRQADAVTLCDGEKQPVLKVSFDAPLFGLWSPAGKKAPFVCIEPWYGRCDRKGFTGSLKEREYGNRIAQGEKFSAGYEIKVF